MISGLCAEIKIGEFQLKRRADSSAPSGLEGRIPTDVPVAMFRR